MKCNRVEKCKSNFNSYDRPFFFKKKKQTNEHFLVVTIQNTFVETKMLQIHELAWA